MTDVAPDGAVSLPPKTLVLSQTSSFLWVSVPMESFHRFLALMFLKLYFLTVYLVIHLICLEYAQECVCPWWSGEHVGCPRTEATSLPANFHLSIQYMNQSSHVTLFHGD